MINVTKTFLPDFDEYSKTLKRAWDKAWITNNGELSQELESKICEYLKIKNCVYVNNGTTALQLAIKTLDKQKEEIITTPFSYVATTHAILWEGFKPVFCDINEDDYCIDPNKIEALITKNTSAILATHVFGNPCDIDIIQQIAKKYKLTVIYDGAHAFGTIYKGKSLLSYGDISISSFHATKLFHTVEGGCVITNNKELSKKITLYRQFGHEGENYISIGINGKNSEFHAAMGLCNISKIDEIIKTKKRISKWYDIGISGLNLKRPIQKVNTDYNFAYYPIEFENEKVLLKVQSELNKNNIYPRRYFYPSLNKLPFLKDTNECQISELISRKILCLPFYFDIDEKIVSKICTIIKSSLKK